MTARISRIISITIFASLIFYLTLGNPFKLWAQATNGFTKIGTVAAGGTNSFTTPTLVDGTSVNFEVTAVNAAGESVASSIVSAVVPATGTHTATISWTPAATGSAATSFNIYDQVVTIPNQPGAVTVTIN
jgi:hypothetical protein